ncbi:DNA cytosine methyltransferase [Xanthobacter autotrophicus]|uniref:DNA cytosine methyltransferase n=1 Tax=Xanthobacter autotrophicus TaxID=280 RepID=UPI00372BBC7F
MGRAYYNDTNKAACAVLLEQIAGGVIPFGDVDDRSIKDIQPDDLRGYTQCHFFAGGGLWAVAARLAGWPDERPLWTGSCPCQPFSVAGKGAGKDDPRHLWPHFHRLIRASRPPVVMGEQVAGKAGYDWFDGVRADLAGENYASRGVDIPTLAVDAPHERNRLYWVAVGDANSAWERQSQGAFSEFGGRALHANAGGLGNGASVGWRERWPEPVFHGGRPAIAISDVCGIDMVHGDGERREELRGTITVQAEQPLAERSVGRNGSFWSDAEWIICHDQKARRTKPGLPLLVDGFPGRVDLWSIAGNAISPILAAEVIAAFLDAEISG